MMVTMARSAALALLLVSSVECFSTARRQMRLSQWKPSSSRLGATKAEEVVVKTGTPLQLEAVSKFLPTDGITFAPTSGGVSNFMDYITLPDGRRYILRIYNNGKNSKLVRFEHEIINQLPADMGFATPRALPSIEDPSRTHLPLSTGDEACIFEIIPGVLPKLTCVEQIGEAAGALNTALAAVKLSEESVKLASGMPYYKLFKVHHAITRDLFYEKIQSSEFDAGREGVNKLVQHVRDMEAKIAVLLEKGVPTQLIHGDLHYDNVLVTEDGKVSGLLDFEYCGIDWRAMELAICLSKYSGEEDALTYFEEFVKGYSKLGILTADEIELVPELIVLRVLSNVVYFVGRTITKEDDADSLNSRAETYSTRINWIYTNKDKIVSMIKKYMA